MKTIFFAAPMALGATVASAAAPKQAQPASAHAEGKPNVVIILADDMGYECIGAYGGTYKTPNIDRLAAQGVKFNYAYAQPLSTPSRVEMMTGRYNYKNYVDFGFMNHDQKTFGNLAKMAGYVTGIAGKWQLGENPKLPAHFGFDSYCLWQLNYPRKANAERYADALLEENGKVVARNADMYGPDRLADFVDNFIEINKEKPFFLYYPMTLVHNPFVTTPLSKDWKSSPDRYKNSDKYFIDMMEYCDRMVGRLVDKLKKEGLFDNTLIIFTGDNGTNVSIVSTMKDGTTIKGGKGMTTDAGTHVAFIASYGKRQGEARTCDDLVDFTDVLPSVAQAMGIAVPKEWDTDGVSFLPQVMGHAGTPRKWAFCHYDNFFQGPDKPDPKAKRYIRDHRYKLYSTGEFYDVKEDIFETRNIAKGKGNAEAEKARQFLASELSKFPAWKAGDIPVKQVAFPDLKVKPKTWKESDK